MVELHTNRKESSLHARSSQHSTKDLDIFSNVEDINPVSVQLMDDTVLLIFSLERKLQCAWSSLLPV